MPTSANCEQVLTQFIEQLEVRGRARREAECTVNFGGQNWKGSWQMTQKLYPRNTRRMDLRQLTVYEHFGCVDMRAITFLLVDQSSSRRL